MGICGITFALLWLTSQILVSSAAQQKVVYVLPTTPAVPPESSLCPTSQCYSLKELGLWKNFTSHMTIALLPGTHTITGNDSATILHVENVYDFSIIGWYTSKSSSVPKIACVSYGQFQIDVHNITDLTLKRFEITGCITAKYIRDCNDHKYKPCDEFAANIQIAHSFNILIEHIMVQHGYKVGLLMLQVYGHIAILHSEFFANRANCFVKTYHDDISPTPTYHTEWYNIHLTIKDTNFKFGRGVDDIPGALNIKIRLIDNHLFDVLITNITLHENRGGNLHMHLYADILSSVNIHGLTSTNNNGNNFNSLILQIFNKVNIFMYNIFILRSDVVINSNLKHKQNSGIYSKNITFIEGTTGTSWMFDTIENVTIEDIVFINSKPLLIQSSNITIQGECLFKGNIEGITMYDGSILNIGPNSTVKFENNFCSSQWTPGHCSTLQVENSNIFVKTNSELIFRNNTGSSSGAITLHSSNIHVLGNARMVFDSNSASNGGGISLYAGSKLTFCEFRQLLTFERSRECSKSNITLKFISNHASEKGGGVYIDDAGYINSFTGKLNVGLRGESQKDYIIGPERNDKVNVKLYFVNNTADIAGNALYGGWVVYDHQRVFNFVGQRKDISTVSSNPIRLCMCVKLKPNCTLSEHNFTIYPGQMVEIEVVAVGQGYGTVPSTVLARLLNTSNKTESNPKLSSGQYLQATHRNCTTLQYTVISVKEAEMIELPVERHSVPNLQSLQYTGIDILQKELSILVIFKDCPVGFSFNYTIKKCSCHPTLLDNHINDCNIETLKILKPSQKWINATYHGTHNNASTGVIVHDHCPFDYCNQNTAHISLDMDHPDDQCDFNHSGTLCGACQTNFSHVFGTSRCKKCSNLWALLLVPAIAVLGIALVILLISLNLTVSIGMINGLIFYANIVRANNATFFTSNTFLSKFIAWLNLDLGFEVCFYNGLDAYTKTWLQLLFPVYIWGLVLTIIVLSHHYTFAARLSGTNAVQVLATLFLFSYAKLIRTIITILQPTMLAYPDGFQRRVWLYDGNVDYLKGKHIPLVIVGLLVLVCLSIPYTTSLLFIQWLRKYNHHRLLRWVGKLKPLFDAYTGPLKEKHCYWFGLLLLVRVALYVVFSQNVSGNTSVNLMAIGTTTSIILSYLSLVGGVYESWLANLMLVSFLLNLIILTMGTHFYGNTQTMSATSVGIAFGLFVFIVMYHIYLRVIETKRGKQLNETIKSKAKQLFSSQRVLINYFNPVVVPQKPVSHSSIELQESLLGDN